LLEHACLGRGSTGPRQKVCVLENRNDSSCRHATPRRYSELLLVSVDRRHLGLPRSGFLLSREAREEARRAPDRRCVLRRARKSSRSCRASPRRLQALPFALLVVCAFYHTLPSAFELRGARRGSTGPGQKVCASGIRKGSRSCRPSPRDSDELLCFAKQGRHLGLPMIRLD
jgi:hypothetical protein